MKPLAAVALLLLSPLVFAGEPLDEGALPAGAFEGVVFTNDSVLPARVAVFLRRGELLVEQVPFELEPGQTRTIRIDRLFAAGAQGGAISFRSSQRIQVSGYRGVKLIPAAKRRSVRFPSTPVLVSKSITLATSKDNTLYQDNSGGISNGAGPHLFAGSTASRAIRRALVAFNVASQIPAGATVTRVVLTLRISIARGGPQAMTLHRVTKDWGEGTSDAGFGRDGGGTGAAANDATWIHTFRPNQRWTAAGGDFDAAPDATASVDFVEAKWESPGMIARVQQWLDQPSTNFGWLVKGNENASATAKRFDSREIGETSLPALLIEYNARQ
ncbi:MAG TPA: hypothetical protein VKB93_17925 [Thermoanaerobaculia bacterium]|nr:hypothetical protein [Thermoanaerobaculia bacterium]